MAQDPDDRLLLALRQNDETRDVDYKAAMSWNEKDKATCCGIVKDVLAMANSGGGLIILGVDQQQDGSFQPSGVPDRILPTWETTQVNNFVQKYADPPINTRLRRFTDGGATFVAIDVPPFPDMPHLCVKDYPGELSKFTLYVRTANNASAPIGSSADFNVIVERAVRNRSDRLLASFHTILVGATVTPTIAARDHFERQLAEAAPRARSGYPQEWPAYTGFRDAAWWPADFSATRFPLDALFDAAQKASVDYRGWPFLFYHPSTHAPHALQDGIEVSIPADLAPRSFNYWQLRQSGFFYQCSLMDEDVKAMNAGVAPSVDVTETALYVAEAIDCLSRLCDALGIRDEDVTLRVGLAGVQDRALVARRGPLPAYRTTLSEIRHEETHSVEEWAAGRVDLAAQVTRELLLRFNWTTAPIATFRSDIERLFNRQLF